MKVINQNELYNYLSIYQFLHELYGFVTNSLPCCYLTCLVLIRLLNLFWFCCSGRIPWLSLNQHSLYVGVVEKPPPPPLTGEQYGKMEPKYTDGGYCQSVLRPQGVFNVPLYFK